MNNFMSCQWELLELKKRITSRLIARKIHNYMRLGEGRKTHTIGIIDTVDHYKQ